ncbi:hypothetical protein Tco_0946626 [Tanacetum coccineum]
MLPNTSLHLTNTSLHLLRGLCILQIKNHGMNVSISRNPEEELYGLWQHYLSRYLFVSKLAEDAGYSREGFFVCALKFSFLKRHRLAECRFNIDEMLNEDGNTFGYVLNTRALICSVIKNSRDGSLNEALAGKEEFLISSLAENSAGGGIIDKYTHSYFYPDLYLDRHTFLIVHL